MIIPTIYTIYYYTIYYYIYIYIVLSIIYIYIVLLLLLLIYIYIHRPVEKTLTRARRSTAAIIDYMIMYINMKMRIYYLYQYKI